MTDRSKGEIAFIDQMTRKLLVGWADHQIRNGHIGRGLHGVYFDFAKEKKWILKGGDKLSASG